MGKNKKSKSRRQSGSKAAHLADSASAPRSSSETIRPYQYHMTSESATSRTAASAFTPGSAFSSGTTSNVAEPSEPVSQIKEVSEDMGSHDRQATERTNQGLIPASGEEANKQDTGVVSLSGPASADGTTAPPDAHASLYPPPTEDQPDTLIAIGEEKQAPESEPPAMIPSEPDEARANSTDRESDAGPQIWLGETQSESGLTTNGGSQSNDDEILAMIQAMERGRERGRVNDSDSEVGSMARGNSELDGAKGDEDHSEKNEGQGSSEWEQIQPPLSQEPLDSEHEAQESQTTLQFELDDDLQNPMKSEPETSQHIVSATGTEFQGLRERQPPANNLSIAIYSQTSPVTVMGARSRHVQDIILQKGQFLDERTRTTRAIASAAKYVDGVGGRPSREVMEALEEFRAYTAKRVQILEEMLESKEPMEVLRRFDQQWQKMSTEEAWEDRQDLRLAAVRAAMHFGREGGGTDGALAVMVFEHKVAEAQEKLGNDDPVALQTLKILRAGRG